MKTHKFDVEDAKKYGIEKAILLEHLKFHQEANSSNDDMVIDGKPHAFLKPKTIESMYPYMNYSSIRRWLRELEEDGIIESCKPEASNGNHLKYYHVSNHTFPIDQNDQSNVQGGQSMNDQNGQSSILPNGTTYEGEGSFFDQIEEADTKPKLLEIWNTYRKSKGKHMNLYEREVLMKSTWKSKTVQQIKSSILYTIENGWFTLQERENKESEREFDPSKSAYFS